jgi:hypothetical protein
LQWGNDGNGALGQQEQGQLQWQWQWGNGDGETGQQRRRSIDRNCNCNGTTGATAIAMAMGHWGTGNRTVVAMAMGQRRSIDQRNVYVVLQRKTSTIVVDETMQNVWRANIPDVLRSNKTGMMCPGILFGVSYLYSKVELVNAFRINSSLKWSKLFSNRVSNIISECSSQVGLFVMCLAPARPLQSTAQA